MVYLLLWSLLLQAKDTIIAILQLACSSLQNLKSYFSNVKFQNVLCFYKESKNDFAWVWTPQTHAKQSKVSKQQSKISIQNLMEIFSNVFNISSLFSSAFSIYSVIMVLPSTHGLAYNFPTSFQEQAIFTSQMLSLSFTSYFILLESAEPFLLHSQL